MSASRPIRRILVVDDDPGIRAMLELALGGRGYVVESAADERVTWTDPPDIVLLDARLGRTGAAEFLAETDLGRNAAIVLMTAAGDAGRVGAEIGADAVLRKPFDLDELYATLDQVRPPGARPPTLGA